MSFDKVQADRLAVKIRKNILRAIASEGKGHIGGSLWIRQIRGKQTGIL